MSYCGKKLSKQGLLTLPALVLLSGCGLDITSEDSTTSAQSQGSTEPTIEIAGAAMKGVIRQGLVTANRLIADKDGYYAPQRLASKPVRTVDDGSYELKLRGKAEGWALVELEADDSTRMLCDVVPQCEQVGTEPVAFGQPMALDGNFILRGAGDLGLETVNLTPLTHLAVTLAERSASGLSPEALSSAYTTVEGWFGLADGALRLAPPDLTGLDEIGSVTADALQVAIANAAFLALVNDNAQWNSISDVLNNMTSQASETGQISLMGDGTNVALADLVTAAAVQASDLQATVDSSVISQKLVVVEYRNVQRFKTIADVYGGSDTSVAETDTTTTDTTTTDTTSDTTTADTTTTDTTTTDTTTADTTTTDTTTADTTTAGTTTTDTTTAGTTTTDTTTTDTTTAYTTTTDTTEPTTTETIPANAALLSWTAPLTRENGDSLAMGEIAGFEVVYGSGAENLDQSLAIGDASVEELLVDELTEGTWFFAIRTLDIDGNRSTLSEVVSKQI
ncbi:hypothetical protein KFJ24_02490 [Marinobacter sediminum]|uniref:hypothetical protein n=1 Tax=Marinobacter sediminum TaxID=256323 RepID=UPI00202E435C|nr:hypothetical protein [Marinobacter sediminum]MCM0611342.1 hypothetical protein [Marinobacter sediminum]